MFAKRTHLKMLRKTFLLECIYEHIVRCSVLLEGFSRPRLARLRCSSVKKSFRALQRYSLVLKFSSPTKKVLNINDTSHLQNARSTAAISHASEGYHFSHDALLTCKLPIGGQRSAKVFLNFLRQGVKTMYYFKNMHSRSLKCAKYWIKLDMERF